MSTGGEIRYCGFAGCLGHVADAPPRRSWWSRARWFVLGMLLPQVFVWWSLFVAKECR